MKPWGTPILMGLAGDAVLLKVTNWFLEVRQFSIKAYASPQML